ncbi:hypothetical protein B9Z19DRAFT_1075745 [Tuber borchii]|uniref:Uncharacterized protein n=1 Tax=Tuber borchii TaxID=42251 RepID=A0A2T7A2U7_TUBBO|nr:hypothetical protein B9Z19DRAFT_1075745 [Tuber borchii]
MHFPHFFFFLLPVLLTLPLPAASGLIPPHLLTSRGIPFDSSITAIPPLSEAALVKAYPSTKTCTNPPFPQAECDTAATAAPNIELAYTSYSLTTLGQKAAVLATLAAESANFKANINHSNNRPGQGTKAMLLFPNVLAFASSIDALKDRVRQLMGGVVAVSFADVDKISADVQMSVRALVLPASTTYAAAAWYLTAGPACPKDTVGRLSTDGWAGFVYYVTKCLQAGSGVDAERKGKWCSAVAALAPAGMDMPVECNGVALGK